MRRGVAEGQRRTSPPLQHRAQFGVEHIIASDIDGANSRLQRPVRYGAYVVQRGEGHSIQKELSCICIEMDEGNIATGLNCSFEDIRFRRITDTKGSIQRLKGV